MSEKLRRLLEDETGMGSDGEDPDMTLGLEGEGDNEPEEQSKEDELCDQVMDALDDLEAVAKQLRDAADGGEDDDYDPDKIDALLKDDDEEPAEDEEDMEAPDGGDMPDDEDDEAPAEDPEPSEPEDDDMEIPSGGDAGDDMKGDDDPDKDHPDEIKDIELEIQMKERELADLKAKKAEIQKKSEEPEEDEDFDGVDPY